MRTIPLIALALAVTAGPAAAQRSIDQTRPLAADGRVQISTVSRDVRILAWDRAEVRITGEIDEAYERIRIDGGRNDLQIRIEPIRHRRGDRDSNGPIEVRVPATASAHVRTVSGDIVSRGFTGSVELASTSGDLEIAGRPRTVRAESVSGDVVVEGASETLHAASVSGDLRLRTSGELLSAKTVSGDISAVAAGAIRNGSFRSMSGDVHFRGNLAGSATVEFESHSGEVILELPGDVSARFELSSFSGEIESGFGPEPRRTSRYTPERGVSFSTGSGDARVVAKSFSGEIVLRRM